MRYCTSGPLDDAVVHAFPVRYAARLVAYTYAAVVGFLPWSPSPIHIVIILVSALFIPAMVLSLRWSRSIHAIQYAALAWMGVALLLSPYFVPLTAPTTTLLTSANDSTDPSLGNGTVAIVATTATSSSWLSGTLVFADHPTIAPVTERLVLDSATRLITMGYASLVYDTALHLVVPMLLLHTIAFIVAVVAYGTFASSVCHAVLWWSVPCVWIAARKILWVVQDDRPVGPVPSVTIPPTDEPPAGAATVAVVPPQAVVHACTAVTTPKKEDAATANHSPVWGDPLAPSLLSSPSPSTPLRIPKMLLDNGGRVEGANTAMLSLLGLPSPAMVVGRAFLSVLEWLRTEHLDVIQASLQSCLVAVRPSAPCEPCRILWRSPGTELWEDAHSERFAFVVEIAPLPSGFVVQPPPSHSVCHALPAAACLLDRDGTIMAWNAVISQLLGWHPYDAIGLDAYGALFGSPECPMMVPASFPFLGEMQVASRVDRLTETRTFDFALLEWNTAANEFVGILCIVNKSRARRRGDAPVLAALGRMISTFNSNATDFRKSRVDCLEEFTDGVMNLVGQLAALHVHPLRGSSDSGSEPPTEESLDDNNDNDEKRAPTEDAQFGDAPMNAWGKLTSQDTAVCSTCYLTTPVGKEFRAGRSAQCDVVIRDSFVSSVQFSLVRRFAKEQPSVMLIDRSANGTFVNVRNVGKDRSRMLKSGDLINFRLSNSRFFLGFRFDAIDHGHRAGPAKNGAKKSQPKVSAAEEASTGRLKPKGGTPFEWKIGEEMLGKGGNAEVFLGINLTNGKLIAVKRVALPRDTTSRRQYDSLLEEMAVLSTASHPNIVQYYGASQSNTHMHILLEFVPGGSIRHLLNNFGPLSDSVAVRYLRQMLQGLAYLHGRGLVHGDLKCANVLVTDKGVVKITDFGTAQIVKETKLVETGGGQSTTLHGTLLWMAPELIRGTHEPSVASDVWSVGCCVLEMLTGAFPWAEFDFDSEEQITNLLRFTDDPPEIPQTNSAALHTVAHDCLQLDPAARPTASTLLDVLSAAERGMTLPAVSALADDVLRAKGHLAL